LDLEIPSFQTINAFHLQQIKDVKEINGFFLHQCSIKDVEKFSASRILSHLVTSGDFVASLFYAKSIIRDKSKRKSYFQV